MWKDTWYLTKRNLSDAMFSIIVNIFASGLLFLFLSSLLLPQNQKFHVVNWFITFLVLFLISLPHYVKRHHNSYARVREDLTRKELGFFRTFPIDPRAMVYSRILSSLLVGCIYLTILVPITYMGLKVYYQLTNIQILGIVLLALATAILLNSILLYLELTLVYIKYFWLSLLPYILLTLTLFIFQKKYDQNIIELTSMTVNLITIVGCFIILFISIANLLYVTCIITRHVRLK